MWFRQPFSIRQKNPAQAAIPRTIIVLILLSLIGFAGEDERPEELGQVVFGNSGSARAQLPFLKGLAALHSFWYDEAADFFQAAQRIDSDFAMAYWGEAMTYNHPLWRQRDRGAAREALQRLAPSVPGRLAKAPTAREKAYLSAVEVLFGEGDKSERDEAYAAAMGAIWESYPEDLEAGAFYALSLMGTVRSPDRDFMRRNIQAAAICEGLFDRNPNHPGLLHYLIHAYDDPLHAPLGLPYALAYAKVAPAAHHALHMPAHIFVQLGMWDRVTASNEDSYAASVAWVDRRRHSIAKRDFHSLSWLHYGYLQQGRIDKAESCLDIVGDAAKQTSAYRVRHGQKMMMARHLAETRDAEACEYGLNSLEASDHSALLALGLYAADNGNLKTAADCLQRIGTDKGSNVTARIITLEIGAAISMRRGDQERARQQIREAADLEMQQPPPSGPVNPLKPALELCGEILLASGDAAGAVKRFEESLLRTPKRAASLLGMARALAENGKRAEATMYYRVLAEIWKQADTDFKPLEEVKAFLKESTDQASN